MYNITKNIQNENFNENTISVINKRACTKVAHKFNVTMKIGDTDYVRKFYVDGKFIGSVHTYPSNNGKFYATSSVGVVKGAHDYLFPTFEGALRFALIAKKVTYNDIVSTL